MNAGQARTRTGGTGRRGASRPLARWGAIAAGTLALALAPAIAGAQAAEVPRVLLAHAGQAHPAAPAPGSGDYTRSTRQYAVPDVTLVDRDERPVRLRELLSAQEPVMLNFIFTTCTAICPVMSGVFSAVPKRLGEQATRLRMISISIDPENDTPGQLKAYARRFGAGAHWQFLTGSVESVAAVQRAFETYGSDKMGHEPLTFLRPAPGRPWVRIEGFASADELAREWRRFAGR